MPTGYARGWALLQGVGSVNRSAYIGSEPMPCAPQQVASSCECSSPRPAPSGRPWLVELPTLPRCRPTAACSGSSSGAGAARADVGGGTLSIVATLAFNRSLMRFYIRKPADGYLSQARLVMRLVLSLRAVGTTTPVSVLVSGERHAAVEALLSAQGASVLPAPVSSLVRVPRWASPWALHSFAKLKALALQQFERVLVLDSDCVALRNLDELLHLPAPAFVFRHKCYPNLELSSAVMVLRPDAAEAARMRALVNREDSRELAVLDDASEQSVCRPIGASQTRTSRLATLDLLLTRSGPVSGQGATSIRRCTSSPSRSTRSSPRCWPRPTGGACMCCTTPTCCARAAGDGKTRTSSRGCPT